MAIITQELLISSFALLCTGTITFMQLAGLGAVDAFYFSGITLTTVGYGDITPRTRHGKWAAMALALCGLGLLQEMIDQIGEYRRAWVNKQINASPLVVACLFAALNVSAFVMAMHFVENMGWEDALYFCFITLATIGYGDQQPLSDGGKIIVVFFMLYSSAVLAAAINEIKEQLKKLGRRVKLD